MTVGVPKLLQVFPEFRSGNVETEEIQNAAERIYSARRRFAFNTPAA